ncbi:alpha/beta-hydrolase [Nemania abortiva]|nr:alpha/beta-hydrolase [Nemania abortiva]
MHLLQFLSITSLILREHLAYAQYEDLFAGFNSTYSVTSTQIATSELTAGDVNDLQVATRYDLSQLANGGVSQDAFYQLPPLTNTTGPLQPGKLLKVQKFTDASNFSLPANTALSRIMYTTTNANGTVIPATAFIMWPFQPKQFQSTKPRCNGTINKAPVILWTHGTAGIAAEAAPSANRALWYGVDVVFPLVLEGYAVIAPDYAGLGLSRSWNGDEIPHQFGHSHTMARDALYSMKAALEAFPDTLQERFVVMGHSQGGGVAWAVAEALAAEKRRFGAIADGYLGSIPASPVVDIFNTVPQNSPIFVGSALKSIFPTFQLSDWFTDVGIQRALLLKNSLGGLPNSAFILFKNASQIIKPSFNETWYVDAFAQIANPGRREFKGPMLVLQGASDTLVTYDLVNRTVQETCDVNPDGDLAFHVVNGVSHVPLLDATRQVWMKWIEDRFEGKPLQEAGCVKTIVDSWLPLDRYILSGSSYPQWIGSEAKWAYGALLNN